MQVTQQRDLLNGIHTVHMLYTNIPPLSVSLALGTPQKTWPAWCQRTRCRSWGRSIPGGPRYRTWGRMSGGGGWGRTIKLAGVSFYTLYLVHIWHMRITCDNEHSTTVELHVYMSTIEIRQGLLAHLHITKYFIAEQIIQQTTKHNRAALDTLPTPTSGGRYPGVPCTLYLMGRPCCFDLSNFSRPLSTCSALSKSEMNTP